MHPDFVAVEYPLEIRVGHSTDQFFTLSVTLCTPTDIDAFVTGHLFTEGIIEQHDAILSIETFDDEFCLVVEVLLAESIDVKPHLATRKNISHPSCGVCGRTGFDDMFKSAYPIIQAPQKVLTAEFMMKLPHVLNEHQKAFNKTGGLHASALFNAQGELLAVFEDVGRHNALDKLIGHSLEKGLTPLSDHIILLSGRISFELVHKALMAGVSTLAAIGAPSSLSIELAQANRLNLIGFVSDNGYNVYQ